MSSLIYDNIELFLLCLDQIEERTGVKTYKEVKKQDCKKKLDVAT